MKHGLLTQALARIKADLDTAAPQVRPGSPREPVHIRFGQSHYGVHPVDGPHFGVKRNGYNIHLLNNGFLVVGPDGRKRRLTYSDPALDAFRRYLMHRVAAHKLGQAVL